MIQRLTYSLCLALLAGLCCSSLQAQIFVRSNDVTNPVVGQAGSNGYTGASWIDYDNDGDLDLFVNKDFLYTNDGNGQFIRELSTGIIGTTNTIGNGNSWGDFDNDGFIDLAIANQSSSIYRNRGDGTFEAISLSPATNGWSSAWADYDNDGRLDLVITHPCCNFIGNPQHSNRLFHNDGANNFSLVDSTDVTMGNAAYTVASWSDFDEDGDMDLFIGSGEVSVSSRDHLYRNQLMESGVADLVRWEGDPIAEELRDGQNWNWIDYDNDEDLDGFVSNYRAQEANDFYRNDQGTFVNMTQSDLDSDLTTASGAWLTNTWGDLDNDGDLDLVLVNDGGIDRLYLNDGDGTFSLSQDAFTLNGPSRGATLGDMDNDGDLDLFINAPGTSARGLYINQSNGKSWANIRCEGTLSNRSAIGTKLRAKANINGIATWQMREISSQSSFCGMNSLRVHFGLDDASLVDSLIVEWPLGMTQVFTEVPVDRFCTLREGEALDCGLVNSVPTVRPVAADFQLKPNPAVNGQSQITYQLAKAARVEVRILTAAGQPQGKSYQQQGQLRGQFDLDLSELAPGIYLAEVQSGDFIHCYRLVVR
ncbi:MAG: FG-GAP-like repeat-containing protein [Bacteroidota bacterium]